MATGIVDPASTPAPTEDRPEVVFLLLDGLRRRLRGARQRDTVLCALGLDLDGRPIPLTIRVVAEETEQAWRGLLEELKALGVGTALHLICCDDHPALIAAVEALFPETPLQISVTHRLLALARKLDPQWRAACLAGARQIFSAPDRDTAVARFRGWRAQWLKHGYRAVGSLESDLASCLTFYRFPPNVWSKIRTVNQLERASREARWSLPSVQVEQAEPQGHAGDAVTLPAGASSPAGGPAENGSTAALEPPAPGLGRQRRHQALTPWVLSATLAPARPQQDEAQSPPVRTSPMPAAEAAPGAETVDLTAGAAAASVRTRDVSGETPDTVVRDPAAPRLDQAPAYSRNGRTEFAPFHTLDLTRDADLLPLNQRRRRSRPAQAFIAATLTAIVGMAMGVILALVR